MAKVTIRDLELNGLRTLVRVDYNVPLDEKDGAYVITDDTRIRETLPTIKLLREKGARIILCAHMGRPKGKKNVKESLAPVAVRLAELSGTPVQFSEETVGPVAEAKAAALKDGEILLLENTRFHAEEEKNDPVFAAQLGKLADVYINDAFGAAHRAHASTEGVAKFVKEKGIGLLMERELKFLGDAVAHAQKPFVVILGGAKVSDKIKVIDSLLDKADTILIGGAMAYTFALALGKKVGKSLVEPDQVGTALAALDKAKAKGVKFLLPVDNYIVEEFDFAKKTVSPGRYTNPGDQIPDGWEGVDIGPETVKLWTAEIATAKTVLWNGPAGVFEVKECAKGTFAIAEAVAANREAVTIIGGGDSVKAVKRAGVADKVSFISTGGGASLEFLEGAVLPGVACIPDKA
ncbi:phosphoglycerate kinase [Verrucomicrobium sp. GAS474]|uniref:phosphoglycerate kinase n=1 Tax=Verrucomicrobium sp. GAS474 TaxID=1882831 RepID=UPI00087D45A8|nr:phosphoglycerate kinase [Verrucomicrobium sp. GAS474]SDU21595.1 phosphoglycerate kinase [Verrucomicrobium sp. GAS474]